MLLELDSRRAELLSKLLDSCWVQLPTLHSLHATGKVFSLPLTGS